MLLDINDRALKLLPGDSSGSAGVFAQDASGSRFGNHALQRLRLSPTECEDRFWRDLGTQPPGKSLPGIRHNADLAWQHLRAIASEQVSQIQTVALPAHYNREQAALLSGILQNLGSEGVTLVNRSLLCLAASGDAKWHFDLQLNQGVLAQAEREGQTLRLGPVREYPGLGLLNLVDSLTRTVQQVFIDKTRFDPLHLASSEQQLFLQLLELLERSVEDRQEISIQVQEGRYQVEITRAQLEQACETWLAPLQKDASGAKILLDNSFPMLTGQLDAQVIGDADIASCWLERGPELVADMGFHQATALQVNKSPVTDVDTSPDNSEPASVMAASAATHSEPRAQVTHALLRGEAWPLEGLALRQENGQLSLSQNFDISGLLARFSESDRSIYPQPASSLRLNGAPLREPAAIGADDLLTCDSAVGTLHFIRVKKFGNASP